MSFIQHRLTVLVITEEWDLVVAVAYLKVPCQYWFGGLKKNKEVTHEGEEI